MSVLSVKNDINKMLKYLVKYETAQIDYNLVQKNMESLEKSTIDLDNYFSSIHMNVIKGKISEISISLKYMDLEDFQALHENVEKIEIIKPKLDAIDNMFDKIHSLEENNTYYTKVKKIINDANFKYILDKFELKTQADLEKIESEILINYNQLSSEYINLSERTAVYEDKLNFIIINLICKLKELINYIIKIDR